MTKKKTYTLLIFLFIHVFLFSLHIQAQNALFDEVDLSVTSPNYSDRARVRLNEIATNGYELGLDATKMTSTNLQVPQLYSRMPAGGVNYYTFSVNSLPRNASGITNVALSIRYGEKGTYTISAANILEKTSSCTKVELIDSISTTNKTVIDLKTTPQRTFSYTGNTNVTTHTRFKLRIYSAIPYVAIASNSEQINCTYPTVTLTANATAGCTYLWSTGQTTPSIVVTQPGPYSVTVTHTSTGKTATDTKTISLDTIKPVVTINSPANEINCSITSIKLTGVATNVSYLWSNASTQSYITVTDRNNYTLTVTDLNNGCTSSATKIITKNTTVPSVEIATTTSELTCSTSSISLNAMAENVSYLWSTEENASEITVTTPNIYAVTVTDLNNGCSAVAEKTITENTTVPSVEIATTSSELTCSTPSISLNVMAENVSYLWSTEENASEITVTTPNIYAVTVTDLNNGCSVVAETTITENTTIPSVEIATTSSELTCYTKDIVLNAKAENVSYLWSTEENASEITVTTPNIYAVTVTDLNNGCSAVAKTTITENTTIPSVEIATTSSELTCSTSSISLNAMAENVSYLWTTEENASEITVTTPNIYAVTVTDLNNGCSAVAETTITENTTVPSVEIATTSSELTCSTSSISLNAMAENVSYLWSTEENASEITVTTPNIYAVTVTDLNNGCSVVAETTITENTTIPSVEIATTSSELTCSTSSISLNAMAENVSYLWSTEENASEITVTTPNIYAVTVTDLNNGCSVVAETTITENTTIPSVEIATTSSELTCYTKDIVLNAKAENVSYLWSTEENASEITVTTPNIYAVTVTDLNNGCSAVAETTITENTTVPSVEIATTSSELTCSTSSISLNAMAENVSYLWSTEENASEITVTTPNIYAVTVTDLNNGCSAVAKTTITENTTIPSVEIATTSSELTCSTSSISLNAMAENVSYLWTTEENASEITVTTPNIYAVTVTDLNNGCSAVAETTITENTTVPSVEISTSASELTCSNQSIVLSVSGDNISYLWSTGADTPQINVTDANTYVLTVTDLQSRCSAVAEKTITQNIELPDFYIEASAEELSSMNPTITLSAIASGSNNYLWTNQLEGEQIVINSPDTYGVTATDISNGCVAYKEITITKEIETKEEFLNQANSPIKIHFTNDYFYFEEIEGVAELRVFDIMGRLVFENKQLVTSEQVRKPGNGVYVIELKNNSLFSRLKVFFITK